MQRRHCLGRSAAHLFTGARMPSHSLPTGLGTSTSKGKERWPVPVPNHDQRDRVVRSKNRICSAQTPLGHAPVLAPLRACLPRPSLATSGGAPRTATARADSTGTAAAGQGTQPQREALWLFRKSITSTFICRVIWWPASGYSTNRALQPIAAQIPAAEFTSSGLDEPNCCAKSRK